MEAENFELIDALTETPYKNFSIEEKQMFTRSALVQQVSQYKIDIVTFKQNLYFLPQKTTHTPYSTRSHGILKKTFP